MCAYVCTIHTYTTHTYTHTRVRKHTHTRARTQELTEGRTHLHKYNRAGCIRGQARNRAIHQGTQTQGLSLRHGTFRLCPSECPGAYDVCTANTADCAKWRAPASYQKASGARHKIGFSLIVSGLLVGDVIKPFVQGPYDKDGQQRTCIDVFTVVVLWRLNELRHVKECLIFIVRVQGLEAGRISTNDSGGNRQFV